MTERLFAETALLPEGWAENVLFEVAGNGDLEKVTAGAEPGDAPRAAGPVIPGMPNLHSHAFQRAMAGLCERAGPGEDSFWTWREVMYDFVGKLTPDQVEAIAAQLYVEMLKSGYTAVGEFHYLHHDPSGSPYLELAEMSQRAIQAARLSGIGITHLPVLYSDGGFGGQPAGEGQRRFLNDSERFLRLVERLFDWVGPDPQVALGMAPHSLRAVTPQLLDQTIHGLDAIHPGAPIHIHVAEQIKEVEDCQAWCGKRPVELLLETFLVDRRWCLIHATHMTPAETQDLAATRATAGVCPTTEANLGDGIFPAVPFLAAGGVIGIGSDNHISVSPIEDLRVLEYSQRLQSGQRNLLAGGPDAPSVGANLYRRALQGGSQALRRTIGMLVPGARADLLVLDGNHPVLYGKTGDLILDSLVFAGNDNPVRDVMVGGRWVVREGRHEKEEAIAEGYRGALDELLA